MFFQSLIFNVYRIIFAFLAIMLIWNLYKDEEIPKKIGYIVVILPFLLRALLIK